MDTNEPLPPVLPAAGYLYMATKGSVAAVDKRSGEIVWQTPLATGIFGGTSSVFVTLMVDGDRVFAHCKGELYCLDAQSGRLLWKNPLEGWGYGLTSLATRAAGSAPPMACVEYAVEEEERRSRESSSSMHTH